MEKDGHSRYPKKKNIKKEKKKKHKKKWKLILGWIFYNNWQLLYKQIATPPSQDTSWEAPIEKGDKKKSFMRPRVTRNLRNGTQKPT